MRELAGFNLFGIFKQQYYMTDEFLDDVVGGGHNVVASVFVSTHAFFAKDVNPDTPWMAPLGEVRESSLRVLARLLQFSLRGIGI